MKILIIEDENAAVRRLEKLLMEVAPDATIVGCLDSVESTIEWFQASHPVDLILLDIHLADGSSFEIFEHMKIKIPVIFTTAYDEYALKAFKVNAVDYLLKPIKINELTEAIAKYQRMTAKPGLPDYDALLQTVRQQEGSQGHLRRMLIRFSNSFRLVNMTDAAYFYTKDKLTFLVTRNPTKRFPIEYPLDKLETLLDPGIFFRINRQFIINVASIKEMHPFSKSRMKIDLEPPSDMDIIVSTERSSDFKKWLVGGAD